MLTRKTYDLQNSGHIDEITRWLGENAEDDPIMTEDLGEESDIASEDELEQRDGDSDTGQEGESDNDDDDTDNSFFLGKDKTTKWNKNLPRANVRKAAHNITTHLPGVKGNATLSKTAIECWSNLFTDEMLDIIVRYTNQYMDILRSNFSRERDIKSTDVIEIRAFIGLLYLAGAYRGNRQSLEELWGSEGDGIEKFSLVMNIKRFKTLIRCLRFDDRSTREERKKEDRLAPVREVFCKFVQNCQRSYIPGENTTIDEMLPGFRGRCPFRQYIPSKPNKYGIKCFALVDARMNYTYNMEIYAGSQPEGPFYVSNKPTAVVFRMAEPLFGSGRNITADNWFTDMELVNDLKQKKLSYVGTVRKNKRQLPPQFVATKTREQFSSLFGFSGGKTLVSYVPTKNKNVILVSTLHSDNSIDPDSGEKNKPEIITFYNLTKGGVDTVDKMCATYNVSRNIKRWPMVIFFTILNVSGINSHVIYLGNNLEPMHRRLFLKRLSHELTIGELRRRSIKTIGIPTDLQNRLKRYRPSSQEEEQTPTIAPKRRRCSTCTSATGLRRLTNHECKKCQTSLCLSHVNMVCDGCFIVKDADPDSE